MWRCGAVPQIEVGKGDAVGGVADCRAVQDKSALSYREGLPSILRRFRPEVPGGTTRKRREGRDVGEAWEGE